VAVGRQGALVVAAMNNHPLGRFNGAMMRVRTKRPKTCPEPMLRPSLRQAVLEAHRLATDMDTMGEVEVDFMRRWPAIGAVDLHVAGEEKPIRVFGFTDELEGA
jgi:hypothetical protein